MFGQTTGIKEDQINAGVWSYFWYGGKKGRVPATTTMHCYACFPTAQPQPSRKYWIIHSGWTTSQKSAWILFHFVNQKTKTWWEGRAKYDQFTISTSLTKAASLRSTAPHALPTQFPRLGDRRVDATCPPAFILTGRPQLSPPPLTCTCWSFL